ncbi:LysR family transcriptional regulator [Enterobacter cloacae]|nr:LysR family transcriptional regulator [Enterobacter cloacae]
MKEKDNAVLRVHSSPTFGLSWLLRRLGRFRAEYPDITINLTCSYENLQFARDNIDIDIRHGIPDWDHAGGIGLAGLCRRASHQHARRSAATVAYLVHQHSGELGEMVRLAQYRQALA